MACFSVTFIFRNIGVANYIRGSKDNRSTKLISHLNTAIFEVLKMPTVDKEFSFTVTTLVHNNVM